jgi:hypothetical protein
MKLTLTGFSQDVDLKDPSKVHYFLVFQAEDGRTLRLLGSKEMSEQLIGFVYGAGPVVKHAEELPSNREPELEDLAHQEDEDLDGATVFGDEEPEWGEAPEGFLADRDSPSSEEEVPSL